MATAIFWLTPALLLLPTSDWQQSSSSSKLYDFFPVGESRLLWYIILCTLYYIFYYILYILYIISELLEREEDNGMISHSLVFDESVTNRRTDGRTDRPGYRDARTHLIMIPQKAALADWKKVIKFGWWWWSLPVWCGQEQLKSLSSLKWHSKIARMIQNNSLSSQTKFNQNQIKNTDVKKIRC